MYLDLYIPCVRNFHYLSSSEIQMSRVSCGSPNVAHIMCFFSCAKLLNYTVDKRELFLDTKVEGKDGIGCCYSPTFLCDLYNTISFLVDIMETPLFPSPPPPPNPSVHHCLCMCLIISSTHSIQYIIKDRSPLRSFSLRGINNPFETQRGDCGTRSKRKLNNVRLSWRYKIF